MLNGSILSGPTGDFTTACLRRMDAGLPFPSTFDTDDQAPWASELSVAATVLAGLAWLTLVFGLRWSLRTKAVATLPSLAAFVVAVVCGLALAGVTSYPDEFFLLRLRLAIDGSAVLALIMILAWQPELRGRGSLRLLLALWGTTAFGMVHASAQWIAMVTFSAANWDVPPGTGYLTGATLLISGLLTVVLALRPPQIDPPVVRTRAAEFGLFS